MSGISCQPYSSGGAQAGGNDERADTLPSVLRLAHFVQAKVLVLECVSQAQSNAFVRQHIRCLHEQLNFHVSEVVVRLEDCWTSNRLRWWLIATHESIGAIQIPPMPSGNSLVVRDLLPFPKEWPEEEESQLLLSEHEYQLFDRYGPIRKHMLKWDSKMPTALHSWGNQTQACACGCRQNGFSPSLLESRGLFGQIVPTKKVMNNKVCYRHLHCKEVALLAGMPPNQTWSQNQRLNLFGTGQLASPIQSIWMASCVMRQVQTLFGDDRPLDPLACLNGLKRELFDQATAMYSSPAPQVSTLTVIDHTQDGSIIKFNVTNPIAAGDFLQAEALFRGENLLSCHLVDTTTGHVCDPKMMLHSGTFALQRSIPVFAPVSCPLLALEDGHSVEPDEAMVAAAAGVDNSPGDCDSFDDTLMGVHKTDADMSPVAMNLTVHQMLGLIPPLVCDAALCHVMRNHVIHHYERAQILLNQEHAWADDEIVWHMTQCMLAYGHNDVAWLDPLLATSWTLFKSLSRRSMTGWPSGLQRFGGF